MIEGIDVCLIASREHPAKEELSGTNYVNIDL